MEREKTYNLNELAMISGFTTRSLRNFLKDGTLEGEKVEGVWQFTEEAVAAFMSRPAVRQSMEAKRNGVVFDFLADTARRDNRACVILNFAVDMEEAMQINGFFCKQMEKASDTEYRFSNHRGITRVILSGPEDVVSGIMGAYYEGNE